MLLFTALAFIIPPVYVFMHAFDAPDGWCNRFSWAFSFLFCTVAVMGYKEIKSIGKKYILILISANMFLYIGEIFWLGYRSDGGGSSRRSAGSVFQLAR